MKEYDDNTHLRIDCVNRLLEIIPNIPHTPEAYQYLYRRVKGMLLEHWHWCNPELTLDESNNKLEDITKGIVNMSISFTGDNKEVETIHVCSTDNLDVLEGIVEEEVDYTKYRFKTKEEISEFDEDDEDCEWCHYRSECNQCDDFSG